MKSWAHWAGGFRWPEKADLRQRDAGASSQKLGSCARTREGQGGLTGAPRVAATQSEAKASRFNCSILKKEQLTWMGARKADLISSSAPTGWRLWGSGVIPPIGALFSSSGKWVNSTYLSG